MMMTTTMTMTTTMMKTTMTAMTTTTMYGLPCDSVVAEVMPSVSTTAREIRGDDEVHAESCNAKQRILAALGDFDGTEYGEEYLTLKREDEIRHRHLLRHHHHHQ